MKNINEEKARRVFSIFDEESLAKIKNYCYDYTSFTCLGTDECYYCLIIKFINKEIRRRSISSKL